ncbi:TPA: glycosyltransferase family 2 protein [Vibrio diabolicus]|nr:glycosyltransferase [Vibrio alginolyticus]
MISVIIPNYNRLERLSRAIESVEQQDYDGKIQIIIVDDFSPRYFEIDNFLKTKSKQSRCELIHLRHSENKFASAARNTGIMRANGDFIALLDSDDAWENNYLSEQVAYYRSICKDNDSIILYGRCRNIVDGRYWLSPTRGSLPYESIDEYIFLNKECCQTSTLFSVSSTFRANLFDESLKALQDPSFVINAVNNGCQLRFNKNAIVNRYLEWKQNSDHVGRRLDTSYLQFWLDRHKEKMTEAGVVAFKVRYISSERFKVIFENINKPHAYKLLKIGVREVLKLILHSVYDTKVVKTIRVKVK